QCLGNPCFEDVSGSRFCGRSCASGCPAGFSCQPITGSDGRVVRTCFPDSEACLPPSVPDNPSPADLSVPASPADLSGTPVDLSPAPPPVGGPVTPAGGQVDRLFFGFTGDTRPNACDGAYPQAIINSIFARMRARNVQFAVDQGDHM